MTIIFKEEYLRPLEAGARLPALYVHHILPIERAQYHGIWNFAESLAADFKKRPHVDSGFSN
ncbi:MAG: hypothetical protein J2P41_13435, partial [Blastocatellia bacterium]|nr:hypothetical protein [Blastocatellia bacterium]